MKYPLLMLGNSAILWMMNTLCPSNNTLVDKRIIGGSKAKQNAYPFMARISTIWKDGTGSLCGGVLIHEQYVLTAAHCVSKPKIKMMYKSVTVTLGDHDKRRVDPREVRTRVSKVIIHEGYDASKKNDIALLQLSSIIKSTSSIKQSCITSSTKNYIKETGKALGWGTASIKQLKSSPILKEVRLPVVDDKVCSSIGSFDRKVMMCTKPTGDGAVFKGDSGGPLFVVRKGKPVLIGIASFVKVEPKKVKSAVFAKLSALVPWILRKVGNSKKICTI